MLFPPQGLPFASPQRQNLGKISKAQEPSVEYFIIFLGISGGGCFPVPLNIHTYSSGKTPIVYGFGWKLWQRRRRMGELFYRSDPTLFIDFYWLLAKQGLGGWTLEIKWNHRNHLTPDVQTFKFYLIETMARIMNASDKECIVYDLLSLQKALKKVITKVTFTPQKIDIVESRGNGIEYTAQYVSLLSSYQLSTK
jgi:hypothetical protein